MKTKLTILLVLIFSFNISAQTSDEDKIKYIRVDNQLNSGNYDDAYAILLSVSEKEKKSIKFLEYSALYYEKIGDYNKEIVCYKSIYKVTKNQKLLSKIAKCEDLILAKEKNLEKRNNCSLCLGTGFYSAEVDCSYCMGVGGSNVSCSYCKGSGNVVCDNCGGDGERTGESFFNSLYQQMNGTNPNGEYIKTTCSQCKGSGKTTCTYCGGKGKVYEGCRYCNSTGKESIQKKCTLHE